MKKYVIIAGVPRAGKSNIQKELQSKKDISILVWMLFLQGKKKFPRV